MRRGRGSGARLEAGQAAPELDHLCRAAEARTPPAWTRCRCISLLSFGGARGALCQKSCALKSVISRGGRGVNDCATPRKARCRPDLCSLHVRERRANACSRHARSDTRQTLLHHALSWTILRRYARSYGHRRCRPGHSTGVTAILSARIRTRGLELMRLARTAISLSPRSAEGVDAELCLLILYRSLTSPTILSMPAVTFDP